MAYTIELNCALVTVIVCSCYIWYTSISLSDNIQFPDEDSLQCADFPILGHRCRDNSEQEWDDFLSHYVTKDYYIGYLFVHSLLFFATHQYIKQSFSRQLFKISVSTLILLSQFGAPFTGRLVAGAVGSHLFTGLHPRGKLRSASTWAAALAWFYAFRSWAVPWAEFNVALYTLFQLLSFRLSEGERAAEGLRFELAELLEYVLYLPYKSFLIMPYPLYRERLEEHRERRTLGGVSSVATLAARVSLCMCARELLSYSAYYRPLLEALDSGAMPTQLAQSPLVVGSLCFALGMEFHLRYMVVFGLPSVFAAADGMGPFPLPICVVRVADYAHIWRQFDVGLYQFFKLHIYLPLCRPLFSPRRKLFAGLLIYTCVALWHDISKTDTQIFVLLNFFVVSLLGSSLAPTHALWHSPFLCKAWTRLGLAWQRRLRAAAFVPIVLGEWLAFVAFLAAPTNAASHWLQVILITPLWTAPNAGQLMGTFAVVYAFAFAGLGVQEAMDKKLQRNLESRAH